MRLDDIQSKMNPMNFVFVTLSDKMCSDNALSKTNPMNLASATLSDKMCSVNVRSKMNPMHLASVTILIGVLFRRTFGSGKGFTF